MSALYEQIDRSASSAFAEDVLDGLAHRQRRIAGQWLHDARGAQLFERMTRQPEYYPTRIESAILEQVGGQIAEAAGPRATLIELGSGSRRTPVVLGALQPVAACVPVDISQACLALPPGLPCGRRVVFFPGSAIGHFDPATAESLLARVARAVGAGALMVIGVDHTRDPARLVRAYDDAAGIAAAFNKNLLLRINRELQGDFDTDAFQHVACFNADERRIEMHLVCTRPQRASVLGRCFDFAIGESIHTANAYKPSPFRFLAMAHRAGWRQEQLWVEGAAGYAVHVLESVPGA